MHNLAIHRKPIDSTPSKFLVDCTEKIGALHKKLVLDMPCGYCRNSTFLKSKGAIVVGGEYSRNILNDNLNLTNLEICFVQLDGYKPLPFRNSVFDMVVIIHFTANGLLKTITEHIKTKGYLIFETYSGRGGNWTTLPQKGEVRNILGSNFNILTIKERLSGPERKNASVKVFAQKI